jgi:hypothetical protein
MAKGTIAAKPAAKTPPIAKTPPAAKTPKETDGPINIRPAKIRGFKLWIVGTAPLITHSWSEKVKRGILGTQQKVVTGGKEIRDPKGDYEASMYLMNNDEDNPIYGFPATGLKKAILAPAHKNRGVARSGVLSALWINHELIRVQAALAGAICDLPLIRIIGAPPEMREDMVRVGTMTKTATLAYRAQFWPWAMYITGRINADIITWDALGTLIQESGDASGIGEWRNEKNGIFGSYRIAKPEEVTEWEAFRLGEGPLPAPPVDDRDVELLAAQ